MENIRLIKIFKALKSSILHKEFKKMFVIIKSLEVILQKNISIDEVLLEDGKPLVYVDINEDIKKEIIFAQLCYLRAKKDSNRLNQLKVYLDDKRTTPSGYIRAFWPDDVEMFLTNFKVDKLSLDHDLGDDKKGTGNDVICYIEEKLFFDSNYHVPSIYVHSDNASAQHKMNLGIKNIINKSK